LARDDRTILEAVNAQMDPGTSPGMTENYELQKTTTYTKVGEGDK
jgi:hypothetical protein